MKKQKISIWRYVPIFSVCLLILSTVSYAQESIGKQTQEQNLTGKVTDEFNRPLAEVLVYLNGSTISAVTNEDGTFSMTNFDPEAELRFSLLGYETKRLLRGSGSTLEVILQRDISLKDREVNLVYNRRPEYSITSSVVTISGEELNRTPHINLKAALAGRLPGLIVEQGSTDPGGEDFSLNMRGASTLNGKSPLVLIDGVVSANLSTINPRDVESVSVYKDAAATVLYGMQGGNGIIAVTTKRGYLGKPRIEVSADYSMQQAIKTPTMVSSGQYASLLNEAYRNEGHGDFYAYSQNDIDNFYSGANPELYPNNNWRNKFVKEFLNTQRVSTSVSGGSSIMKYYANGAYTHQGGPFEVEQNLFNPEQSMNRYNFRSNLEVKINPFISAFTNLSGYVQRSNGAICNAGDIYASVFDLPPTMYGPLTPEGQVVSISTVNDPTYGRLNRDGYKKQLYSNLNAILGLNVDLSFAVKGLSTTLAASFDSKTQSNVNGQADYERWIRDESLTDTLAFIKNGTQVDQEITLSKAGYYSFRNDYRWVLDYKTAFGSHAINTFGFIRLRTENAANLTTGIAPYVNMTYGGNVNYSYDNVLFADLSASYDGSEQFAPGHRYGLFPSASVAWVATNQDFLKDKKSLTYLKVRASYGQVGNDQMSGTRYLYLDNIRSGGSGGISKFITGLGTPINEYTIGNSGLTWETSTIANIGVEVGLWNQLSLTLDLFHDRRTEILVNDNTQPMTFGLLAGNLAPVNEGEVLNKGFEVSLGYSKDVNKDLYFGIQSNFGYNKNEVINSNELIYDANYAYRTRVAGYSVGQQWGLLVDRSNGNDFFNSQEEIDASGLTYEGVAPRPGDLKFKDLNGDKIINNADQAPIGYSGIPRISWGMNLTVKWKSFDANILFQGLAQFSSTFSGIGFYESYKSGTFFDKHLNAWTADRYASGEKITSPALSTTSSASQKASDYYNYNLSFGRLKNVEVGYQLPTLIAKKINCQAMRVYVSGLNLVTFSKMGDEEFDVENSGVDSYPLGRYFNLGLNLVF